MSKPPHRARNIRGIAASRQHVDAFLELGARGSQQRAIDEPPRDRERARDHLVVCTALQCTVDVLASFTTTARPCRECAPKTVPMPPLPIGARRRIGRDETAPRTSRYRLRWCPKKTPRSDGDPSYRGTRDATSRAMMSHDDVRHRLQHERAAVLARQHDAFALVEILEAIERLDAGTYGSCRTCGDVIDEETLSANCCARRCFDCEVTKSLDIPELPA
ncbi:MAG: hypothetical protein H0T46_21360 [Deltaproteobacteria bacterium]|nr:hypothetical protein [Deltaproteobacteria bacterium]